MQFLPAKGACPPFLLFFQPFFDVGVLQVGEIFQTQSSMWSCLAKLHKRLAWKVFAVETVLDSLAFCAFLELAFRTPFVDEV